VIAYTLRCHRGHEFDGWFRSSSAFDEQSERGQLTCPSCNSIRIEKAVMAPAVSGTKKSMRSKAGDAKQMRQFATGLRNNANAEVKIIGHTDSTGTDAINNPLSVERAASTRDYLIARGVRATAFNIDGRGSREPVADNSSDAGRAQNRRVEIFVGERPPQG
jgi:outer membrane protein OmpA-like peptidoglycan-associated protein